MLFGQFGLVLDQQRRQMLTQVQTHVFDNVPHEYQAVTLDRLQADVETIFSGLQENLRLLEESVLRTAGRE